MPGRHLILAALVALSVGLLAACQGAAALPTPGERGGSTGPIGPTGAPPDGFDKPGGGDFIPEQPQLIIYNGSLDLEVADVDGAVSQVEALVKGLGGHVAGSRASTCSWAGAPAPFGHWPGL